MSGGWHLFAGYVARKVVGPDGLRRTVYRHREVMAAALGRPLRSDEHVHHRDGCRSNNALGNLELLSPAEHSSRHRAEQPTALLPLTCTLCGAGFSRAGNDERGNRKAGKRGPFCGKRCAGKFSRAEQIAAGRVNLRASASGGRS